MVETCEAKSQGIEQFANRTKQNLVLFRNEQFKKM